ncbi:MAG: biotin/lipoyl-containing protein, partial [Candidatus Dormiibacterota bacterium]
MPKRTLEVTLPQMGESVTEGVVGMWRKRVGEQVNAGEVLVEVQTDKIDAEVPAPESGTLSKILAEEGQTVAVGAGLAEIELGQSGNGQSAAPSAPAEADPVGATETREPAEATETPEPNEATEVSEPASPQPVAKVIEVPLPQMGESVTEGVVGSWLKKVGDPVNAGETLVEIQTDKIDAEVPSPASGTVTEILVPEGETVAVGAVLARVTGSSDKPTTATRVAPPPAVEAPSADPTRSEAALE